MGLALVNFVLPLVVLRLVAGRRRWSVRVLMALPVAAAIPLMALLTLEPCSPGALIAWVASAKLEFVAGHPRGHSGCRSSVPVVLAWSAGACRTRPAWPRSRLARVARHREHLALVRHEVDAIDRAIRLARLVPDRSAGGIRREHAALARLGEPGDVPRDEAAQARPVVNRWQRTTQVST